MKKKFFKNTKGITLIALVVTIIVLLILAGVTLSLALNSNGVFQRSKNAATAYREAEARERNEMSDFEKWFDGEYDGEAGGGSGSSSEKTGDEDTSKVGVEVHIGDYVNYNPIAAGISEKTVANGYKYQSTNENSGAQAFVTYLNTHKEDSSNPDITLAATSQDFTVKEDLKWVVIGKENGSVLITTETPINPDSGVISGVSSYVIGAAQGYENCLTELDNISAIYGHGVGAQSARSIKMSDINNLTGVTVSSSAISPAGVTETEDSMYQAYGGSYSIPAGNRAGWSPSAWISASDKSVANAPGISGNTTRYVYYGNNSKLKTSDTTSTRYKLAFGENGSYAYWLGTRSECKVSTDDGDHVGYGISTVNNGLVNIGSVTLFASYGEDAGAFMSVRPVVKLSADAALTLNSKNGNIATWDIGNE